MVLNVYAFVCHDTTPGETEGGASDHQSPSLGIICDAFCPALAGTASGKGRVRPGMAPADRDLSSGCPRGIAGQRSSCSNSFPENPGSQNDIRGRGYQQEQEHHDQHNPSLLGVSIPNLNAPAHQSQREPGTVP